MKLGERKLIKVSEVEIKLKEILTDLLGLEPFRKGTSKREKPRKDGKFDNLWMGPYIIHDIAGVNSFHLSDMDGEKQTLPVNGKLLKLFFSDNI